MSARSCLGFIYALQGGHTLSKTGNLPSVHVCSGDTSGTTIVPTCSSHSPPFLRLEGVIRLKRDWFRVVRGTRSTKHVTIDLSLVVAKREGSNDTQDTNKCQDCQLYTYTSVYITDAKVCPCLSGRIIMTSTRGIRVRFDPLGEIYRHSS